jgi:uncharacterized cupin superfamily protein
VTSPVVNIDELKLDTWERGTLYAGADVRIGPMIGVKDLGISYSEVPPGKSACPFHNHHVEDEMFIVIEGEGTYRFGDQTHPIRAGSVLGAPAGGRETAHQIINTGAGPLRYYGISTMSIADVCEYPDSGKFGVFSRSTRNPYDKSTVRHLDRLGNGLDYWDGEPGS